MAPSVTSQVRNGMDDLRRVSEKYDRDKSNVHEKQDVEYEVRESYTGDYQFAPIEEAQVSRAMIKR